MTSDYKDILVRQEVSFDKIKQICTNYRKDSSSRKTLDYLVSRLEAIDAHWREFVENHQILCEMTDKDIGYFNDEVYNKLKILYDETRQHMMKLQIELLTKMTETEKKLTFTSKDLDQRGQDLLRQQECNFRALQRVFQKIDINNLSEK